MTDALPALLALAFFWPALFADRMPMFGHFIDTFLPYRLYTARALAAGQIPLWAPEPSLGSPLLANAVSGVLYPPSAIIYLAPNPLGVGLYLALHFWAAAAGLGALLERHGYSPWSGAFGGVVYAFGGFFVATLDWSQLAVVAWVPFTLVAAERLVELSTPGRHLALVALFALQALGGAPEFFAQSVVLAAAFALFARGKARSRRRFFAAASALGLALAISTVQLLPSGERLLQMTSAGALPRSEALGSAFSLQSLASLVLRHRPDGVTIAPSPEQVSWWSLYVGLAPLVLAILAAPLRESLGWVALLLVALALSLGSHTPIFPFLDEWVPWLFAAFRSPQSFVFTVHLSLAVLAAVGFSRLERQMARAGRIPPGLLAAGLFAATVADLWTAHQPSLPFDDWSALVASSPPAPLRDAGAQARIFRYRPQAGGLAPSTPELKFDGSLVEIERRSWADLAANVPLVYGIGFIGAEDSVYRRVLRDALRVGPIASNVRLPRAFGSEYFSGPVRLEDPALELVRGGSPSQSWIYRTRAPAPRVYLAKSIRAAAGLREALDAVGAPSFVCGADAIISGPLSFARTLVGGAARIAADATDALTIETESPEEAFLVINDSFYPGWIADVDGAKSTILPTNGIVRGLWLPAGPHRVELRYEPRSFKLGLGVSVVGLLLAVPLARRATREDSSS